MNGALGIHVFGSGVGESVVLELPNGKAGLIDCFSGPLKVASPEERPRANPILRFLTEKLKAPKLAFVGFTHPHEDHGRGLSHVLEEYADRIEQIWIFPSFQSVYLQRFLKAVLDSGAPLPVESLFNDAPGTFSVEVAKIRNLVIKQCDKRNKHAALLRFLAGYKAFKVPDEPIHVHFLGPTDRQLAAYESQLIDNVSGAFRGDLAVSPDWRPDRVNHNAVSPAVLLEFGQTKLVFGGDMEREAWTQLLAEQQDTNERRPELACHFVKVSHHGSVTGYTERLYEDHFGKRAKPVAVLTPFNRHRYPLPSRAGINHILPLVSELLATNLSAACRAAGVTIPSEPPPAPVSVPWRWAVEMAGQKDLVRVLDPALVESDAAVTPAEEIPASWIPDLIANPQLVALLHPELRQCLLGVAAGRDADLSSRVSLYFNDQGQELGAERDVGADAGELGRMVRTIL